MEQIRGKGGPEEEGHVGEGLEEGEEEEEGEFEVRERKKDGVRNVGS